MAGLDADRFPLESISLGGLVGFRAKWRRYTESQRSDPRPDREITRFDLETFASELRLHIYF